jgi:hypothetical protein
MKLDGKDPSKTLVILGDQNHNDWAHMTMETNINNLLT